MSHTDSLAKYLWKEQHVVFLNAANANDFNLLDVLVKHGSHDIINRGPVLVRIGSLFKLCRAAPPEDEEDDEDEDEDAVPLEEEETSLTLETLEKELETMRPRSQHVKRDKLGDWSWKSNSSFSIKASAAVTDVGGSGHVGSDQGRIGTIKNIKSETVDIDSLNQVFGKKNRCALDVQQIRQRCPTIREINEIWVVNKILYTSGIDVGGINQVTVGAGVQLLPVITVGLGVHFAQGSHKADPGLNNASASQPFGFQAIRLKFENSTGEAISWRMEMGKGRPVTRRDDRTQDIVTDPQKEPQYNMADLLDIDNITSLPIIDSSQLIPVNNDNSIDSAVT